MVQRVSFKDAKYPDLLAGIDQPPRDLYYKGEWEEGLFSKCLAVVGSRRMSEYGKRATQKLVFEIASRGVTIVSGFMYGVDVTAHQAAVASGGKTIAVLGYGINKKPPGYLRGLYQEIVGGGGGSSGIVLSELGGEEAPQKWYFPKRNRIIAGLSQAVLVVEAAKNSGSLITAGYAKEYQRELFAVPGEIDSGNSRGTLKLIREGARMVTGSNDILRFFNLGAPEKSARERGEENGVERGVWRDARKMDEDKGAIEDKVEDELINLLSAHPLTLEEIVEGVGAPVDEVCHQLTMLTLSGQVVEDQGRFYAYHS